ncbi:rRNA bioproteinsis protein rrp5 [Neopestalotiopsis sp. 37M]|nr:rRNA bioproteinsis protein rrp5 [Neopestalotiopsis sp. 37M]
MGSLKRKDAPGGGASASKAAKTSSGARPSKTPKSDKTNNTESKPSPKSKTAESKPATAPLVSRLKDEEPLFPRGGGSVLSPLEHKQIQIQAKNDVLFEQASGKKTDKALKKKKSKGQLKDANSGAVKAADDSIRIESLNYKRLVKGSLVLARVAEINTLDLTLALPNNLTGHVPITSISDALNERIAAEAAADDEEEEETSADDVDLKSLYAVGQYLRAYVNSTTEESGDAAGKPKKRIELSLRPEQTNSGLSNTDVVTNTTVMATVTSVEDHGFVMDLGLENSKVKGFLSRKELDPSISEDRMQPGFVLLCMASSSGTKGKIIQLTTLQSKLGKVNNAPSEATTINTFLPGSAAELLITEVSARGVAGKVIGSLDVTADHIHSGSGPLAIDLEEKFKVGKKVKARVICNFPASSEPKLGVSFLEHVAELKSQEGPDKKSPVESVAISSIVEKCTVTKVEPDIGVFVDIGLKGMAGFVHISRLKDGKVDMISQSSGAYQLGSVHRGRVVGYNPVDGLFQLSFEKHVLEQAFLRIEDIPVGQVVDGTIEKLVIGQDGVNGLLVKLAESITGFVPEIHLADIKLQHPEKKFREGMKIKARVLSTDPLKRQVRLTLKKTLLNSEIEPLHSFDQLVVGMQAPATIISVVANGAIVQFYGSLRGFLPVSEMSEAYIRDPKEYFRVGQVVEVHVLNFDTEAQKLYVSCKDPSAFGLEKQKALQNLKIGDVVSAKVVQKTEDHVFVELADSLLKAMLSVSQLTDGSSKKNASSMKKVRVGQTLSDLAVLDKNEGRRSIILTQKPSLIQASRDGKLLNTMADAKVGEIYAGFVRNITLTAVFVQFGGHLNALLPKARLPQDAQKLTDFGLEKGQSIAVKVVSVDFDHSRMVVSSPSVEKTEESDKQKRPSVSGVAAENPVDKKVTSIDDIAVGQITKARISSIKNSQLNVKLADNIQGRVDVSQVFDSWDDIKDTKHPLKDFKQGDVISVRVLGAHDAKNHRFLPISHRSTHTVLELSAKPSDLSGSSAANLTYEKLVAGASHVAFVNNVQERSLWVNLSPNVRGRINAFEVSDDVSLLEKMADNFPVGSALRVRVVSVDAQQGRLDLSARSETSTEELTWDSVKQNMVLPGRITKINERQIMVQLSKTVSGPIHLTDISDDYNDANTMNFAKNNIIRVSVVDVDKSNKKVRLSARHSRVLNSSSKVQDKEISKISQLNVGDIIRGFVKHVSDKGVFVALGGDLTAMVKISDLSDRFLKEWKDSFQIDQLVKGRITSIDSALGHIQMSLKSSVVDKDFVPLLGYQDLRVGQIITGKVRKVEEFGAFILVDGTANVSGLCHRSELAEKAIDDARKLLNEGDAVKAIILKLDAQKKRINFGLKPSYFEDEDTDMSDEDDAGAALVSDDDDDEEEEDDEEEGDEDMSDADSGVLITGTDNMSDEDSDEEDEDVEMTDKAGEEVEGLDAGGFDWDADALDKKRSADAANGDSAAQDKKKKRKKAQTEADHSGDLDAFGPRTAADYEQLLNRKPNSSELWIQYMAYQMQASELTGARKVVERAVSTINSSEETEKLNAWVAYLNLEVHYGNDETVDEVFKRALQVNDQQEVYQRLASIYIHEDKPEKADELFQTMTKKFGASSPDVWYNYAHWLHSERDEPERARALLPRATQSLPKHAHLPLLTKMATLQFTSKHPNPELGRTMFEGLLSSFPKRFDLWNQLLDHEDVAGADKKVVRDVFERALKAKGLKARAAKKWFKRWADWETKNGDKKSRERVSARAAEWVKQREEKKNAAAEAEDDEGDDE